MSINHVFLRHIHFNIVLYVNTMYKYSGEMDSSNMRVFGYARTSTFLQEASIDAQKKKIKQYCEMKEWTLEKLYVDKGKSGANTDRPAWQKLMKEIEEGRIQAVVFTKFDRVARSLSDLLIIVDGLEKKNVNLCSIDDSISTEGPQGRLMLQIIGAFAEFERTTIRQRLEEGLARAKAQGKRLGRKPKNPDKKRVLELYKLGLPVRRIAVQMNVSHSVIYKKLNEWNMLRK